MLKREAKVYVQIVDDVCVKTLQRIIRRKVEFKSIIHTDIWKAYDGLVDLGYEKHFRVKYSANEFALKDNHINGIESFWGYAKHRIAKFKGIKSNYLDLSLRETEFRFNNRYKNIYEILKQNFKN